MLLCTFSLFTHPQHPLPVIRASSPYHMPPTISGAVDFIAGLHRLPRLPPPPAASPNDFHIESTPHVLRKRYNVTKVGTASNNSQAVFAALGQHFTQLDLDEFWAEFGEWFPHSHRVEKVVGPNHPPSGVEASLDVQYIMSLGANISTWFWSMAGLHEGQEPFLQWMIDVGNTTEVPYLFSVSYGDDEDSLSIEYMQRINVEFQKAGLRGISILIASGDSGAGCNDNSTAFTPNFPVSSPYVTGVGGTAWGSSADHEITNYLSGGGFSNVFTRPDYQAQAVDAFLHSNASHPLPPSSYFNASGRAYPDVAAMSEGFPVVSNLIPTPGVAGTSCATPTFSGIVALINDARLAAGKPR